MSGPESSSRGWQRPNRDSAWADYLGRIRSGDEQALASLYDESAGLLYGLACRMTGNEADAEEVVADVFCQIWRGARSWDAERGSASAWMIMMCRSRCIDKIRSRALHARREVALKESEVGRVAANESRQPLDGQTIRTVLDSLPGSERELLNLAFFSGLTHAELSTRLNLPLGTVKGRLRRAIAKLRLEIDGAAQ